MDPQYVLCKGSWVKSLRLAGLGNVLCLESSFSLPLCFIQVLPIWSRLKATSFMRPFWSPVPSSVTQKGPNSFSNTWYTPSNVLGVFTYAECQLSLMGSPTPLFLMGYSYFGKYSLSSLSIISSLKDLCLLYPCVLENDK